jgi:hypothetical protein
MLAMICKLLGDAVLHLFQQQFFLTPKLSPRCYRRYVMSSMARRRAYIVAAGGIMGASTVAGLKAMNTDRACGKAPQCDALASCLQPSAAGPS